VALVCFGSRGFGGGTNFSLARNLAGGRSDLFQVGGFARHNAGPNCRTLAQLA
jgi:hypothetical protein